jgi:hypothetical protein
MIRKIFLFILLVGIGSGGIIHAAENISNSSAESIDACVAVNSAGEVGVIWIEKVSEANQRVFFSIRRSGKWSSPAAIPGQSGNNSYPRIARGVGGGFAAAWWDKVANSMRFSQYKGSWSTPVTVSQVGGFDLGNPAITTTTNGRIAVAWQRGNKTFPDIYVATCQNGNWSSPVNISNTHYGSKYVDLTYGPSGEIYAVWQDNLYVPTTGMDYFYTMISNDRGNGNWTTPQIIDGQNGWTFRPMVAVNPGRDILSCFYYYDAKAYWAAYFLNGSWQKPQVISDVGRHQEHNAYYSAVCPFGSNGFLYIYRDCGLNIIYRVVNDGSIGKTVALTSGGQCYHPYIDYNSSVGAVACWTDRRVNSDVFVSIFDPDNVEPEPPPPPDAAIQPPLGVEANYRNIPLLALDMRSELVVNRNLFTVQYYRKITWAFDPSWSEWNITVSKYRVYRKLRTSDSWEALAEVAPSVLLHIDKNGVDQEDRFDYQVRAVDSFGNEFYAYNWIRWAPNPLNVEYEIKVKGYRVYRKLSGQSDDGFVLWQAVDASTNSVEDHSNEIRQNTQYDYAVTAVRDTGEESVKAKAQKIAGSTNEYIRQRLSGEKQKQR